MIQSNVYNRHNAVQYAHQYGLQPNTQYPYYEGNDCTNFVSQCLQAGGCKNHFHPTHPWWCVGNKTSICWSVASSLYWYIKICTKEDAFGIKANTMIIEGNNNYTNAIASQIEIGDLIQYVNFNNRIQHSAIITGFQVNNGLKQPLITQHTYGAIDIPWRKQHKKTIFHHIIDIN